MFKGTLSTVFVLVFFLININLVHAGLASSSWPTTHGNGQRQGRAQGLNASQFTIKSVYTAPVNLGQVSTASDGTLYSVGQASDSGSYYLYAINSAGTLKWKTALTGSASLSTPPLVDSSGNIWVQTRNTNQYLTRYDSSGNQLCQFNTGLNITTDGGTSPIVDSNNNAYFAVSENSSTSNLFAINSNCSQIWTTTITKRATGSLAISPDEETLYISGQYPGTNVGPLMARKTSDGTSRWEVSSGAMWKMPSVSSDNSKIFALAENPVNGGTLKYLIYAFNPSNGASIWNQTIINDTGVAQGGYAQKGTPSIDQQNNIYVMTYDKILSYTDSGALRWAYENSSGHDRTSFDRSTLVDSQSHVYAPSPDGNIYVLNSADGSLLTSYTKSADALSSGGTDKVYFISGATLYALIPWTLNLSVDNDNPKNGEIINFTVKSSMLKRDPASSVDNKVQVKLPNGDKVELGYDSATTDSSGNALTVWKGSYTWNLSIGAGNKDVVAEAIAYKTTTSTTTFFASLPTDFNNTGVNTSLCINSQGEGNCATSSTTSSSTPPGFLSKGDYKITYNASLESINSSPQIVSANNPNTFFDASKSLVILNPSSLSMDSSVMLNPLTSTQLTAGDNPDRLKYTLPQSNGFTQTGDFWDLRAYAAFNGAGYTTFQKPITLQLPYDTSKLNGASESQVRILYLDKLSNRWKTLPDSVINYQQKTIAVLTKEATIFTVGASAQVNTSRVVRSPAEVQGVSSVKSIKNTLKKKEPSLKKEAQPSASLSPAKKAN